MERLNGKVAIITGATSGMGRETAKLFAREGAKVVIVGRRQSRIDEMEAWAKENNLELVGIAVGVDEDGWADKVVKLAVDTYGKVDILFSNHGMINQGYTLPTLPNDIMMDEINTNFTSHAIIAQKVLPLMIEQNSGSIIFTSSMCGMHGFMGECIYTATKHAIVGLTKNLGYQYAKTGIRVNSIAPGAFNTEVKDRFGGESFGVDKDFMDILLPTKAVGQAPGVGELSDIANLALFLCSDDAKFIKGAVISCDGGYAAY